jgi:cell division protein FtsW (lipid II flippase)
MKGLISPLLTAAAIATGLYLLNGAPWWQTFTGVCGIFFLMQVYDEFRSLKTSFFVADQELKRVSNLADHLQQELWDVKQELTEVRNSQLYR